MIKLTFLPPVDENFVATMHETREDRSAHVTKRTPPAQIPDLDESKLHMVTGTLPDAPITNPQNILGMSQIAAIVAKHFREIASTHMLPIRFESEHPPHFFRSALQRELNKLCVHCRVYKRSESDYIIAHVK